MRLWSALPLCTNNLTQAGRFPPFTAITDLGNGRWKVGDLKCHSAADSSFTKVSLGGCKFLTRFQILRKLILIVFTSILVVVVFGGTELWSRAWPYFDIFCAITFIHFYFVIIHLLWPELCTPPCQPTKQKTQRLQIRKGVLRIVVWEIQI